MAAQFLSGDDDEPYVAGRPRRIPSNGRDGAATCYDDLTGDTTATERSFGQAPPDECRAGSAGLMQEAVAEVDRGECRRGSERNSLSGTTAISAPPL